VSSSSSFYGQDGNEISFVSWIPGRSWPQVGASRLWQPSFHCLRSCASFFCSHLLVNWPYLSPAPLPSLATFLIHSIASILLLLDPFHYLCSPLVPAIASSVLAGIFSTSVILRTLTMLILTLRVAQIIRNILIYVAFIFSPSTLTSLPKFCCNFSRLQWLSYLFPTPLRSPCNNTTCYSSQRYGNRKQLQRCISF